MAMTGSRAIVEALLSAGVDHAFGVPGESFLGLLDAFYDEPRIRVIATRHEGGASFMAEAYGKLTGRPAVCMGTRMVGAGNLAIGIHTARQDSSPLIAMFGQVSTEVRHREAFQEADLATVFGPLTKFSVEPPTADRLGELTLRAAREAVSGRPGPVTVALREELLNQQVPDFTPGQLNPPRFVPDPDAVRAALALISTAERPILLLGANVLASHGTDACVRLAEALNLPVVAAWRRPDVFPNDHPQFLGQVGTQGPSTVQERVAQADVLIALGTRLSEYDTFAYRIPVPGQKLIHVDVSAEALGGHAGVPDVACLSDARLFAEALLAEHQTNPIPSERRTGWSEATSVDRDAWERASFPNPPGHARQGYADQLAIAAHLRRLVPADAILTTDAGNFGGWPSRYVRFNRPGSFLGPTSGAMGYGVPSAIAAKLAEPNRPVIAFCGDGGFLMTGMEIETAARENTPFVVLVYDNQQYGTIRMHQLRDHPGRQVATALGSVDYAAYSRSLGGEGFSVRDESEFPQALTDALACGKPAVIHLRVDPEQIAVGQDTPL